MPQGRKPASSAYIEALAKFGEGTEELYEHLANHRYDDLSSLVGYLLERAKRDPTTGIQTAADAAELAGRSRSMLSAILYGKTLPSRETYVQLARVLRANPIEFFVADGTIDPAWIDAYQLDPAAAEWAPLAQMISDIEPGERRKTVALIRSILETIMAGPNAPKRKNATAGGATAR